MVVLYYAAPPFRSAVDGLQPFVSKGGLPFAALATAASGAILPECARLVTRRPLTPRVKLLFQCVFFAILGISVDLLYILLARLLGSSHSFPTVAAKVLVDQFLYSPTCSMVLSVLAFSWEANRFSLEGTRRALRKGGFGRLYFPLLVTCWCFWIPVLAAVYALPTRLQFLLFLCANGAWSLLLVVIASEGRDPSPVSAAK
jgi:hypothetical protein